MMKRTFATAIIGLPLAAALAPTAATAAELVAWGRGGIFFGVGPVVVSPPVYVAPAPVYVAPPAYYTPTTVWVPGHWEYTRYGERYWVSGHYEDR